jgi:hypothetical protein
MNNYKNLRYFFLLLVFITIFFSDTNLISTAVMNAEILPLIVAESDEL